ncbi:MAG: hypothetical protein H6R21_2838, partial [Proteobacteria bacterium]|nr:hypothetical protein [Pseudomonadota bacterium]
MMNIKLMFVAVSLLSFGSTAAALDLGK